jgi:phosphoribosyl 1,2-cyclic phosphodiesterase
MRVTFRGVRGSVPWSVPEGIIHGCNTPCIEIYDERNGAILVLDAGSGIVGIDPARLATDPRPVSLLLTHYHWDHLLGLPFFATLYQPGWDLTIHAPTLASHDPAWLDTVFKSPFFPVPYDRLPNKPRVRMVAEGPLAVAGFEIEALPLNHPGGCLAYRIKGAAGDFVYATDHEFGDPAFDEPLADFARGAAAIVLDGHFTPEELPQHRGWGHSDWRQCAEFAAANGIGALWLFHHKPGRSDQALADIRVEAQKIFAATNTASEETSIDI